MNAPAGAFAYQACYCEENAWHLCVHPGLGPGPRAVVFVSNAARAVAFEGHRAAGDAGVVAWDYHVVVAVRGDAGWRVWDLDTVAPPGVRLASWIEASFGDPPRHGPVFAPRFRVIAAPTYRRALRSDRSHMRDERGDWRAPPPPWPCIGDPGSNLEDFVDTESEGIGRVADLDGLVAALDREVADQSSNVP